jgi:hypothetical protein
MTINIAVVTLLPVLKAKTVFKNYSKWSCKLEKGSLLLKFIIMVQCTRQMRKEIGLWIWNVLYYILFHYIDDFNKIVMWSGGNGEEPQVIRYLLLFSVYKFYLRLCLCTDLKLLLQKARNLEVALVPEWEKSHVLPVPSIFRYVKRL